MPPLRPADRRGDRRVQALRCDRRSRRRCGSACCRRVARARRPQRRGQVDAGRHPDRAARAGQRRDPFSAEARRRPRDREAWRQRVACVYQHSTIIPDLTVAENLFVNRQPTKRGWISWTTLRRQARAVARPLERVDVPRTCAPATSGSRSGSSSRSRGRCPTAPGSSSSTSRPRSSTATRSSGSSAACANCRRRA